LSDESVATGKRSSIDALRIDRQDAPERSGRGGLWIALAVVALVVAALAWMFLRGDGAKIVSSQVVREVRAGTRGTVLNASGYVVARRKATVSSKITGKVVDVRIEEGMVVEADQVLATLDRSNVAVGLELAKAQQRSAGTALEETRVRLRKAGLDLERARSLSVDGVSSQADVDVAAAEREALEARLARLGDEVKVAARRVAQIEQQLDDTIIRAPFAGVVVSKNAQPGEMISPTSAGGGFTRTGIGTIVDMDSLEIEVDVNEAYINRVEADQEVEATLDAYPDWKIPARVIAIVPTADRQKATVRVRIGFDELDSRVLPDMGVKVAFRSEDSGTSAGTSYAVPSDALRSDNGKDIVFVVKEGQAERRAVRRGGIDGDDVLLESGISAGERVIVDAPADLQDGDRIEEEASS